MLLAAGGIADGRGLAASLVLGADGVLLGTRFYAAEEALSAPAARKRILLASGDDVVRTSVYDRVGGHKWPSAYTNSVLQNEFTERWGKVPDRLNVDHDAAKAVRVAIVNGDFEIANVTAGQSSGLIGDVRPAARLVADIVAEAASTIGRTTRLLAAPRGE